jgi:uncharacterized lipoprotein YajG
MKRKTLVLLVILGLIAAFSGCAGSKIYFINVRYMPEEQTTSSTLKTPKVVGICPFEDVRKDRDKHDIGFRHRRGNRLDILKVYRVSLSESVSRAVKDHFVENGFEVTECRGWDLSPEGLAELPGDLSLVVGGKIESFMVKARSGLISTETDYRIKIVASVGQVEKRRVVTRTVAKTFEVKEMRFNIDEVSRTLNQTLTDVIQRLFKDNQ